VTEINQQRVTFMKALPGAGHISAALIYVTMGLLAGLVAVGSRGQTPDLRETIRTLLEQPFGPAALLLIVTGSLALLVWRLLQAFADLEKKGTTFIGILQRARYFFSGAFYGGMPILVWRMFTGVPVRSGEQWARELASKLILVPFGWTLLVTTGLGLAAYGAICVYRMCRGNFGPWFHCEQMTAAQKLLIFSLGRLGYAARGAIFLSIGYFVIRAGWNLNPTEIAGQAGALYRILHQPFGPYMLGLISLGLISFGLFSLGALRFGKLPVERMHQLIQALQAKFPI
jgi:hypothetical protein